MYKDGLYKAVSSFEVEEMLLHYEPISGDIALPRLMTDGNVQETIRHIKRRRFFYRDVFNQERIINFKNGFLNIQTGELLKHSSDIVSTIQLPYNYDKKAKCDLFIKTVHEILEGDENKINILQEFFGYCLTKSTKFEKSLFLVGVAQSGKSTLIESLHSMLGDENVSNLSLDKLANPRFVGQIVDKYANISSEIPKKVSNYEDDLKKIVSGEPVTIDDKYVTTHDYRPFCKLIFAGNDMPRITDTSEAIFRRMILINFTKKIENNKKDIDLKDKLKLERAGIFNWAMIGYKRLFKNKKFTGSIEMDEDIHNLRLRNNTTLHFILENYIVKKGSKSWISVQDIYHDYQMFCRDSGCKPLFINNLSKEIEKSFGKEIIKKRKYGRVGFEGIEKLAKYADLEVSRPTINEDEINWDD